MRAGRIQGGSQAIDDRRDSRRRNIVLEVSANHDATGIRADRDQAAGVFAGLGKKKIHVAEDLASELLSSGGNREASGRRCGR